jgi:DNA invertase Pin-like site-specific DNA recombinase
MALVGYARVSTQDQHPEAQVDALEAAGCDRIFVDRASGTLAHRPELDKALHYVREGDVLLVTRLDRLGRSVKNLKDVVDELQARRIGLRAVTQGIDTTTPGGRLFFHILAAIAEFEHDLIVERTRDGLAAARSRGRKGGPRYKMTKAKIAQARLMYEDRTYTVQQIADTLGVSRPTIYRYLDPEQTQAPQEMPAV